MADDTKQTLKKSDLKDPDMIDFNIGESTKDVLNKISNNDQSEEPNNLYQDFQAYNKDLENKNRSADQDYAHKEDLHKLRKDYAFKIFGLISAWLVFVV